MDVLGSVASGIANIPGTPPLVCDGLNRRARTSPSPSSPRGGSDAQETAIRLFETPYKRYADLITNKEDDKKIRDAATCYSYGLFAQGDKWLLEYVSSIRQKMRAEFSNSLVRSAVSMRRNMLMAEGINTAAQSKRRRSPRASAKKRTLSPAQTISVTSENASMLKKMKKRKLNLKGDYDTADLRSKRLAKYMEKRSMLKFGNVLRYPERRKKSLQKNRGNKGRFVKSQ